MSEYLGLAEKFINVRRSLPYIKFDNEVSRKVKYEIFILSYLKLHGGMAHPKELSDEFVVSSARMAVLLNQLEEKGYIVRVHDEEDNRQTIIRLQPEGMNFFDKCNDEIIKFIAKFFEELGAEDAKEFVRLYTRLMDFVS